MSATTVEVTLRVKATEVFTAAEAPAAPDDQSRTLTTGGLTLTARRNATTTPKVDKPPVSLTITLGGSPTTIDLTAVAGLGMPPGLRTLDMTGAKVIDAVLRANATNVAPINVAPGSLTPYPLFGTGNDIDVHPGRVIGTGYDGVASGQPVVSASVKKIDVSGTAGDVLYIDLTLGT